MAYQNLTLTKKLVARCGTGKDFANGITSEIEPGTKIDARCDRNGRHYFEATEYGRRFTYCVDKASFLEDHASSDFDPKADAIEKIKELMAAHGITVDELT